MLTSIAFNFTTTETQKLTISWGDGFFGEIDLTVGTNTIARNEHEYTDKLNEHTIVFSFEKPKAISAITTLNVNVGDTISEDLKKFTGLEKLVFGNGSGIQEFPADLSTLTNLKNLSVLDSDIPKIDDSIFSLPLEKLSFRNSIDFSTTEASDSLERLAEFVFLEDLNFAGTKLTEFPVNFINRNRLVSLTIGENNEFTVLPINIPISVTFLNLEAKNPQITSYENFDRLVNLERLLLEGTFDNVNVAIGDELASCELLKTIRYKKGSVNVLARTNAIVNNLFNFIVTRTNAVISTGGSNKFRDMTIQMVSVNNGNNRPSGTYQAPTGFN
jgi:Leucine-rich repeat (LRR) protein